MALTYKKKEKGFTLLEMLISITLFSLTMVIAMSAVLTILDLNRKTQSLAAVTNSVNSTLDSMVRLLKSGERNFTGSGVSGCPDSRVEFDFYDVEGIYGDPGDPWEVTFVYSCDDKALYRSMVAEGGGSQFIRLTPEGVAISRAEFDVTNTCQDKVGIFIEGSAGANKTETEFQVQTSVTRRSVVGTGSC